MLPLLFAAALLGSGPASAAPEAPEARSSLVIRGDGFVRSPVNAIQPERPKLRIRQNEVAIENQDAGTIYTIDVEVGTPPQSVTLILDTGSPDTWVNPSCEFVSSSRDCDSFRRYDHTKSRSINATRYVDHLLYGSGNATVQYVRETVKIGSATITNQIIGVGLETHNIPLGIVGLSPPLNGENQYPYILDTMKAQGVIKSRAFSLDLRGVDSPDGALIFGGIDTGKYIGDLQKLPMLPIERTPRGADRYYVSMTGVGLTYPDGSATRSQQIDVSVFLDSGGTLSRLPTAIFQAFAASFEGAEYDSRSGLVFVPCDVVGLQGSVDFYFGGKVIRVPFSDFIWQVQGFCVLGVLPDDDEAVLGDTFLRAAYVVFDQDNRNLHIAQAANCGTNLVAIGSGVDAVPSQKGACTATSGHPAATAAGGLDVTGTRSSPTAIFTGEGPTGIGVGPGPVATRISGTGSLAAPTATASSRSGAGKGVGIGFGAAVAVAVANVLAWMI
ncbi:putative aspartic-type endopeptidase opsB [Cladorrhinum samala]|uniref:Aspartic-type endopeptidase opsB n=1 Tax=Cladorrhinum samala TaxID=585594 RepID=A0AAV9HGH3_9PEZI|nr:putative aspartic-type endopeptidase opsB [Cladorrhinum samala]